MAASFIQTIKERLKTYYEKGLIHVLTGSFLTKCISFFGSIVLVNALSKFEYGVLTYLENIYSYIWILAGMGMSNAILRFVVLKDTLPEKRNSFLYSVRKGFLFNLLLIILAAGFNLIYPHREDYRPFSWLLFFLLASLPFQYMTDNAMGHERAMFNNKRYVAFSLIMAVGVLGSKILFGRLFGLRGAVMSQAAMYVVLGLLFFISTSKKHYGDLSIRLTAPVENGREVDSYAFQYMITNGLWAIFMLNDTYLLGLFSDAEILAEYKVAYTIPGCVSIISSSIGIFVAPYFVQNEKNHDWVRKNYKTAFLATAAFVGIVCLGIALLAKPIVHILYQDRYINVVPIMRILLIAAFCNCGLRYTTANILSAMGQVKYNMIVSAVGTALQIGINLLVIPKYGSTGVAVTSCVVYSLMALALFVVFRKKYFARRTEET